MVTTTITYLVEQWAILSLVLATVVTQLFQTFGRVVPGNAGIRPQKTTPHHEQYL